MTIYTVVWRNGSTRSQASYTSRVSAVRMLDLLWSRDIIAFCEAFHDEP